MGPDQRPLRRQLAKSWRFPEEDPVLLRLYRLSFGYYGIKPNVPLFSHIAPSMVRISPEMNEVCGALKKATASATWSGEPHRPPGIIDVIRSTASGVFHS